MTKSADNPRPLPKAISAEEITNGTARFQEVLAAINDFSREGFPYRDAARTKAESQLRECVKQIFGEHSHEFRTYRNYKLLVSSNGEIAQSIADVERLIQTLQDKKLELQGFKSPSVAFSTTAKTNHLSTAQMRLVPPGTQARPSSQGARSPLSSTDSTTTATNPRSPATSIAQPSSSSPPPKPQKPQTTAPSNRPAQPAPPKAAPAATPVDPTPPASATQEVRPAPAPPALGAPLQPPAPAATPAGTTPSTSATATQEIHPIPAPPPHAATPVLGPPSQPPAPAATPASATPSAPATQEIPPIPAPTPQAPTLAPETSLQPAAPQTSPAVSSFQTHSEQDPLQLIRKVCLRFHAVVRQLRLRKDSRPTVEVEDDYDLQDLLRALLKMEFDEVGVDEWTPPYTESLARTALLLNREQIALVAKKTRPGLTAKDIADQVKADSAFYSARNKCTTLFCFVYDPEGRIGSPKRLETDLTSVSDRYTVEVLVAPK